MAKQNAKESILAALRRRHALAAKLLGYSEDQERDERGRWTSGGGSGTEGKPSGGDSARAGSNAVHEKAQSRLGRLLAAAAKLPVSFVGKIKDSAVSMYGKLEGRYGRGVAIGAIAAFVAAAPVPLPGTSFAAMAPIVAGAELYKQFGKLFGKKAEPATARLRNEKRATEDYTDDELHAIGKAFMNDLMEELMQDEEFAVRADETLGE